MSSSRASLPERHSHRTSKALLEARGSGACHHHAQRLAAWNYMAISAMLSPLLLFRRAVNEVLINWRKLELKHRASFPDYLHHHLKPRSIKYDKAGGQSGARESHGFQAGDQCRESGREA